MGVEQRGGGTENPMDVVGGGSASFLRIPFGTDLMFELGKFLHAQKRMK